ncbi:MAG: Uma2 family endonuclease [Nostoc sp. ChiSLP02]|nr:Uma2 family endonuclease [Nostoc sp. DedSLP05]MDZ8097728.1 Uma2 family endonuclease [Nostoc sp. DedSLP01]MDZ8183813.1 Uma2 family endonuclease [Nostoc sp. ChiSLP02]
MNATTVTLPSTLKLKIDLSDEQFFQMCQKNSNYRFERTASGEIVIMTPSGSDTDRRNVKITTQLDIWNEQNNLGEVFGPSAGFKLPNGAERSPDASWVKIERWNALTAEQQEKFAPICPDFVVELRSPSDSLKDLQEKMQEYIENCAQLGWLIDRKNKRVEIYRPGKDVEILNNPSSLSGENVLPGFVLNLQKIM